MTAKKDPKDIAALARAKSISASIARAEHLLVKARIELRAAEAEMQNDFPDVAKYETKDVDDLITVLRVAVLKPVRALENRWLDNVEHRKS